MKKLLFLTLLFALPLLSAGSSGSADTKVYICTGKSAYSYHAKNNCRGIKNCKADIKVVTLTQAQELKRKPCGYCYK